MKALRPVLLALMLFSWGSCSATAPNADRAALPKGLTHTEGGSYASCCDDYEDLKAHSGKMVALTGVYKRTVVSRRPYPDPTPPYTSGPVILSLEYGGGVMLGIYYEPSGGRAADEISRFNGKEVEVHGLLQLHTPEMMHEGMVMQTMIGPYVDVHRIELAP
jgi:hypothetical protein